MLAEQWPLWPQVVTTQEEEVLSCQMHQRDIYSTNVQINSEKKNSSSCVAKRKQTAFKKKLLSYLSKTQNASWVTIHPLTLSVHLHTQWPQAMVKAQFGHWTAVLVPVYKH